MQKEEERRPTTFVPSDIFDVAAFSKAVPQIRLFPLGDPLSPLVPSFLRLMPFLDRGEV